ncbi:hypothetical protein CPB85DRAFT_1331073 [Mucidula mucida]|nr:hypothetical protein CPB85DRAFT_1331073 [Mucidula mucida]
MRTYGSWPGSRSKISGSFCRPQPCYSMLFFALLVQLAVSLLFVTAAPAPENDTRDTELAGLSIGDIINALGVGLVSSIVVNITVSVVNPLPIELTLDRVASDAGINSTVFASFDHTFPEPVVVPIFGTAKSGVIENVLLTQGALASLAIIPLGFWISSTLMQIAATIFGQLGIPVNIQV